MAKAPGDPSDMNSSCRDLNLPINAALRERFEAHALAQNSSLQASRGPAAAQDAGAREALTKLKQRTEALESLTRQMTTHMRMLQEEVDQLKTPATISEQQQISEMLPALADDFAADF